MKSIKLVPILVSKWIPPIYRVLLFIIVLVATLIVFATPPPPFNLKVMKMGLGSGSVNSVTGINCGGDCDESFGASTPITLQAVPDAGSVFVRWEGDITGSTNPVTATIGSDFSVRAIFDLTTAIPTITDFTPEGIQAYLNANPIVNNMSRFVKALPRDFKQNWILMSRSESLQTGTAESPRLLLPNIDAKIVFTLGMMTSNSYPGSHPDAIEMMQWDPVQKNFRFHEIILNSIPAMGTVPPRTRAVSIDDSKCFKCHSTNNVLNRSTFPGTTGISPGTVQFKNKPNWDTYDSWGGMMPFNRDRIYQGSLEAAAFRKIFNLWTWRSNDAIKAVIEQLELQPPGIPPNDAITRTVGGINDGHINFSFDATPPVLTEPVPTGTVPSITSTYIFNGAVSVSTPTTVIRGGAFITLHHSGDPMNVEGRGVQLFDLLGGQDGQLNPQRITDELINHHFATGSVPIDVRPIALAIADNLFSISGNTIESNVSGVALTVDQAFFNARNGMSISDLVNDTKSRAFSMPRRKADIEKINLERTNDVYLAAGSSTNGLIQQYGAATAAGVDASMARIRQEVFRRPNDLGFADRTVMGGIYVDRELETNIQKVALFRYFLEPLGISVDKWSMGVRGRSRTYSFADILGNYTSTFAGGLIASLSANPTPGMTNANNDAQVMAAVNSTLSSLPAANAIPTFTDVQRIFNRGCIECHGGLDYPPYKNFGDYLDLSEDENPPATTPPGVSPRLARSYGRAIDYTNGGLTSALYNRLNRTSEDCALTSVQMMPCGGPALSKTDIETIRRWIQGARPYTNGDPHIRTVDGVNYDFQAAGEFTLLRGEGIELQVRQMAVETSSLLGPNAYTGLTSCVSLNTAVALRIERQRITYQPTLNGRPGNSLQLRIDGKLTEIPPRPIPLASGGRIVKTSAPGGIQVEAPGGTVIIITPAVWELHGLSYINIDTRGVRATQGLMGSIAPGNWLPALPDGSQLGPKPRDLNQRFKILYDVLGKAWRVNDSTTLFDYAAGTSTNSFAIINWPAGHAIPNCILPTGPAAVTPLKPLSQTQAEQACAGVTDGDRRINCIQDVMVTGDVAFAKAYLAADKINRNTLPNPPKLIYPKDLDRTVSMPVDFKWDNATDKDGDPVTYKLSVWPVNDGPNNNNAIDVSTKSGSRVGRNTAILITGVIGLLLLVIFYFSGKNKKPVHLILGLIIVLIAMFGAYLLCGRSTTLSYNFTNLQSGQAYYWKVIAEDNNGGVTESEMQRFEVK
ncbi:MAG TPA: hypothetical protein VFZ42_02035 [Chitinophagaceae bacterium]